MFCRGGSFRNCAVYLILEIQSLSEGRCPRILLIHQSAWVSWICFKLGTDEPPPSVGRKFLPAPVKLLFLVMNEFILF